MLVSRLLLPLGPFLRLERIVVDIHKLASWLALLALKSLPATLLVVLSKPLALTLVVAELYAMFSGRTASWSFGAQTEGWHALLGSF